MKELRFYMYCTSLKDLDLDEPGRISYTYKALGAGFWALRQKDFRQAIQAVVLQVFAIAMFLVYVLSNFERVDMQRNLKYKLSTKE